MNDDPAEGVDGYDVVAAGGLVFLAVCLWLLFGIAGPAALGCLVGVAMVAVGLRGKVK